MLGRFLYPISKIFFFIWCLKITGVFNNHELIVTFFFLQILYNKQSIRVVNFNLCTERGWCEYEMFIFRAAQLDRWTIVKRPWWGQCHWLVHRVTEVPGPGTRHFLVVFAPLRKFINFSSAGSSIALRLLRRRLPR